jgi:hypothetical protein
VISNLQLAPLSPIQHRSISLQSGRDLN